MSRSTFKRLTALAICIGLFIAASPVGAGAVVCTADNFVVEAPYEDPSADGETQPNGDADGTVANSSGSFSERVGTDGGDQTGEYSVISVWEQMFSVLLQMIGYR